MPHVYVIANMGDKLWDVNIFQSSMHIEIVKTLFVLYVLRIWMKGDIHEYRRITRLRLWAVPLHILFMKCLIPSIDSESVRGLSIESFGLVIGIVWVLLQAGNCQKKRARNLGHIESVTNLCLMDLYLCVEFRHTEARSYLIPTAR